MKKKKELRYLDKLFKKMQQQLKKFTHTQSPEALHGFRVQVKKTRSFLTLLQTDSRNNKLLETFKPVKKIFKQTGIIRDAQVHEKQAKENHIDSSQFHKQQSALQQQETDKLLDARHKHLRKIKKVKRQLQYKMHIISNHKIEEFFTAQISNTKQLLNSHNFSEQLHNGRKMLKHLLYNQHLIPQAMSNDMHLDFDNIDAMQQSIGDWHDNKLAIEFFSKKIQADKIEPMNHKQEKLKKKITAAAASFAE